MELNLLVSILVSLFFISCTFEPLLLSLFSSLKKSKTVYNFLLPFGVLIHVIIIHLNINSMFYHCNTQFARYWINEANVAVCINVICFESLIYIMWLANGTLVVLLTVPLVPKIMHGGEYLRSSSTSKE